VRGNEALVVRDHEKDAVLPCCVDHPVALRKAGRHRLLNEHVVPAPGALHHHRAVMHGRRADARRVEASGIEHLLPVRVRARDAEGLAHLLRAFRGYIAGSRYFRARLPEAGDVPHLCDLSQADDRDPQRFFHYILQHAGTIGAPARQGRLGNLSARKIILLDVLLPLLFSSPQSGTEAPMSSVSFPHDFV
jgi:hypothetical protein